MNKLSIFLSMILAVAVAAFAASGLSNIVPALTAGNEGTQGYWFTLSQVQTEGTADDLHAIRYLTVKSLSTSYYEVSTVNTDDDLNPANSLYWHAETVTNKDGQYYIKNKGGKYLSVKLESMKVEDMYKYYYTLTTASATKDAATWEFEPETGTEKPITLVGVPASVQTLLDKLPEENQPVNTSIAMSQKNLTVHLTTEDGEYVGPTNPDAVGTMTTEWTLNSAEVYFAKATDIAIEKVNELIACGALIDNASAIETAENACNKATTNAGSLTTASSNPQTVISTAVKAIDTAYANLFKAIGSRVVTLGSLSTDGKTLSDQGSMSQLATLWTLRTLSNGTVTLENQISGVSIAYIPEVPASWDNATGSVIPAVPAHFGVASSPTPLTLTPTETANTVTLAYGDIPFTLTEGATEPDLLVVTNLDAAAVADIVANNEDSEFATERQAAIEFLGNIEALAQTSGWPSLDPNNFDEYLNPWAEAVEALNALNPGQTTSTTLTPIQILANAKDQMGRVASIANRALVPVMLTAGDKYLVGSFRSEDSWDAFGNEITIDIPTAYLVNLDGTAKADRLSGAFWAFEYVKGGMGRIFNSEGVYLAVGAVDMYGNPSNATTQAAEATLFTINQDGSFSYATGSADDAEAQGTFEVADGTTTVSAFGFANTTPSITATAATVNADGVAVPAEDAHYYRIASVGAGGVISGLLPGDVLTHTGSSIGSYWWFEADDSDIINTNAYIIHSIFPGYYLGADMTMSDKPCRWYVNGNGITRPTNVTTANVFNGYLAGAVLNTNVRNTMGTAINAANFTANGQPNPALSTSRYASSAWRTANWLIVPAADAEEIVRDYSANNFSWQVKIVKAAYDNLGGSLPFAINSLSAAYSEIESLFPEDQLTNTSDIDEVLANVIAFNDIIARTQAEFDREVIQQAAGSLVKIANEGRSFLDWSGESYLSGAGSQLSFVPVTDTAAPSEWTIVANGTKGLQFRNGAGQLLGSPLANGSISSAAGTYRLSLDIWWHDWQEVDGTWVDKGTDSPWYSVPSGMTDTRFDLCAAHGFGLENVAVPGIGLAAKGGQSNDLCGAGLNSYYSQWHISLYTSGIEAVEAGASAAAETDLFDLRGIRVDRASAAPGIYISRRTDGSAVKVRIP